MCSNPSRSVILTVKTEGKGCGMMLDSFGKATKTKEGHNIAASWWMQIVSILRQEYGDGPSSRLTRAFWDVVDLYQGRWPDFQACQVGYHTLEHAMDVALASTRIIAGWNREHKSKFPPDMMEAVIVAAMFHDAGYIKEKGDDIGKGGKFTFRHVERGMRMARQYLVSRDWPHEFVEIVVSAIGLTEFHVPVRFSAPISEGAPRIAASTVATADLVAQIADIYYMERLPLLLDEFEEAYAFEGEDRLKAMGIKRINSLKEMVDGTPDFFRQFVVPRLEALGRMDAYLTSFYGIGRNPYHECIAANLFRTINRGYDGWRYLGEVLKDFHHITSEAIEYALDIQKDSSGLEAGGMPVFGDMDFFQYINHHSGKRCLGEILIDLGYITPEMLRHAVAEQCLSSRGIDYLSKKDLFTLVRTGMLITQMRAIPGVCTHVLEMLCETVPCEALSILIADESRDELVISIPVGPNAKELRGMRFPSRQGIAGWVYHHGRPSIVDRVEYDSRFFKDFDQRTGFRTRNIVAVPLMTRGRPFGVIEAMNKIGADSLFGDRDVWLLGAFAAQLAGVMESFNYWLRAKKISPRRI